MSLKSSHSSQKKRNKLDGMRVRLEIRRLRSEGKQPAEICKILDLSYDNFRYYCSKIYREDKKELQRERTELLAHEISVTKYRLENVIAKTTAMLDDTSLTVKDRIDAGRLTQEVTLNIIRLIMEGPKLLENVTSSETEAESIEDDFPADEFVKFAEATAAEKFQRSTDTTTEGDSTV